jgi:hypothetical protein
MSGTVYGLAIKYYLGKLSGGRVILFASPFKQDLPVI